MSNIGEVKEMAKSFCLLILYDFKNTVAKLQQKTNHKVTCTSVFNFKDYCNVISNNLCHRPLAVPYPLLRCISIALIFCRHKSVQHGLLLSNFLLRTLVSIK